MEKRSIPRRGRTTEGIDEVCTTVSLGEGVLSTGLAEGLSESADLKINGGINSDHN